MFNRQCIDGTDSFDKGPTFAQDTLYQLWSDLKFVVEATEREERQMKLLEGRIRVSKFFQSHPF